MFSDDRFRNMLLILFWSKWVWIIKSCFKLLVELSFDIIGLEIIQLKFEISTLKDSIICIKSKFWSNSVMDTFLRKLFSIFSAFIIYFFLFISSLIHSPFSVTTAKYLSSFAWLFFKSKYINFSFDENW